MNLMYKRGIPFIFFFFLYCIADAQLLSKKEIFTYADTLRGSNGPGRDWWDVLKYDLHVQFNIGDSTITGYNTVKFKALKAGEMVQIDLQEPMVLDSITTTNVSAFVNKKTGILEKGTIAYPTIKKEFINHIGNAYFFDAHLIGADSGILHFTIYYHGKPTVAQLPPWEGGLIWKKDKQKNPWVSVACQGLGASVWYPCKDYQGDEPDSAEMHLTVPDSLVVVGNGRYRGKINNGDGTATYDWAVMSPINNYNIVPYIGKYSHFSEVYAGENGPLDLDYWVLDSNVAVAKKQFADVPKMMKTFEHWFGPYPFYKDGYKLVESPHLGMEHQSAVAYGNGFKNGYLGKDLSGSGWGLQWDYIIIHESGHEWFANNISTKDIADMWVHEAFTSYSETLFTEYYYGKEAATAYIAGIRNNIENESPVIGPYLVNKEGSGDMYTKGANMIHNIRQVINNDVLFRKILRGLNQTFYHQTVTTSQIETYISKESNINFSKIFDQYLRTINIPTLEYKLSGNTLRYRYTNCITGFNMPLQITCNGQRWVKPTTQWQTLKLYKVGVTDFSVDPNFYIFTKKVD